MGPSKRSAGLKDDIASTRAGADARTGFVIAATVLYVLSLPYLGLFSWFWFID